MEAHAPPNLALQAEKVLPGPARTKFLACCPTMDLVAVVSKEENLDVYRFNGQRAFGRRKKDHEAKIEHIGWKFNGACIAVAWNDGTVDVLSAETGRVVPHEFNGPFKGRNKSITVGNSSDTVSCLAWGVNFIDVEAVKTRTGDKLKQTFAEDKSVEAETVDREPGDILDLSHQTKDLLNAKPSTSSETLASFISDVSDLTGSVHPKNDQEPGSIDDWDEARELRNLEEFLERQPDLRALDLKIDLPEQLILMDAEHVLPRLPVLPTPPVGPFMRPVHRIPEVFMSQTAIDALFHSYHLRDHNSVDILLRCHENGTIQPTIYDSLEIDGICTLDESSFGQCKPVLHASHPYSRSHSLLVEIAGDGDPTRRRSSRQWEMNVEDQSRLALVPLTFNFIASGGMYLYFVATRTVQLQNLLRYVENSIRCISMFWYHSQDLPAKFMRNVNESLAERGEGHVVPCLYHLAVVGTCVPALKEWLLDELQDAGHRRWDHSVSEGYKKVVDIVLENLLPALDRCTLIVSTLRGLAKFHETSWLFRTPIQHFTAILGSLRSIRLLAHEILTHARLERRQFIHFSKWLRHEIDLQALETSSDAFAEASEREIGVDYAQILDYLKGGLTESSILQFVRRHAEMVTEHREGEEDVAMISYDDTRKALDDHKRGAAVADDALNIWNMFLQLQDQCRVVFSQITLWQAQNSSMNCGLFLENGIPDIVAMNMIYEPIRQTGYMATYVALVPPDSKNEIRIHHVVHKEVFENVEEAVHKVEPFIFYFRDGGEDSQIMDIEFGDDYQLLVLYRTKDRQNATDTSGASTTGLIPERARDEGLITYLLSIPYARNHFRRVSLMRRERNDPRKVPKVEPQKLALPHGNPIPIKERDTESFESVDAYFQRKLVKAAWPHEKGFIPIKIDAAGRKDRRVIVLLDEAGGRYRVYDMDNMATDQGRDDERWNMDMEEADSDSSDSDDTL